MLGNPMLVAGGGGGIRAFSGQDGFDASITQYGVFGSCGSSTGAYTVKGAGLGVGGNAPCGTWGGGGAGYYGNGAVDGAGSGKSWANGLAGGAGSWPGTEGSPVASNSTSTNRP